MHNLFESIENDSSFWLAYQQTTLQKLVNEQHQYDGTQTKDVQAPRETPPLKQAKKSSICYSFR